MSKVFEKKKIRSNFCLWWSWCTFKFRCHNKASKVIKPDHDLCAYSSNASWRKATVQILLLFSMMHSWYQVKVPVLSSNQGAMWDKLGVKPNIWFEYGLQIWFICGLPSDGHQNFQPNIRTQEKSEYPRGICINGLSFRRWEVEFP